MARDAGCSALMVERVQVLTQRKVLNEHFGVALDTGIVGRIVRTVVTFGYKIIRPRSVEVNDESQENRH